MLVPAFVVYAQTRTVSRIMTKNTPQDEVRRIESNMYGIAYIAEGKRFHRHDS